jgi:hypothetical protein
MNLGVEIWVSSVDDPASPDGNSIAMMRTVRQRNQILVPFHAERIHNIQIEITLRFDHRLRILLVGVWSRCRWGGKIPVGGVGSDVEFPIGSERVGKGNVSARLTILIVKVINDRAAGDSDSIDIIILVRI